MSEPHGFRQAAMAWLERRPTDRVDYSWLSGFEYEGNRIALMDRQRGIRKPAGFDAALAIRTTYTHPDKVPPYDDEIGLDGLQRYKYRGNDPMHPENIALRNAKKLGLPIIWFVGVRPGLYEPIYPVWVVGDDPENFEFSLAVEESQRFIQPGVALDPDTRRWVERQTRQRLHQRVFRSQVLLAYDSRCAICRIRHVELLDAAHIVADSRPNGQPIVPNGLSLCKIHHAAFDHQIIGIRPNLTIHVRQDVLEEVDGWMLKGGIQGVHDQRLSVVPRARAERPSEERLEERYAEFLAKPVA